MEAHAVPCGDAAGAGRGARRRRGGSPPLRLGRLPGVHPEGRRGRARHHAVHGRARRITPVLLRESDAPGVRGPDLLPHAEARQHGARVPLRRVRGEGLSAASEPVDGVVPRAHARGRVARPRCRGDRSRHHRGRQLPHRVHGEGGPCVPARPVRALRRQQRVLRRLRHRLDQRIGHDALGRAALRARGARACGGAGHRLDVPSRRRRRPHAHGADDRPDRHPAGLTAARRGRREPAHAPRTHHGDGEGFGRTRGGVHHGEQRVGP